MSNLAGKGAIVTGAAQGLGYAVAKAFAQEGMRVVLMDVQAERLQATVEAFQSAGGTCMGIPADLTDASATKEAVETALDWLDGAPQVLVHNAAILRPMPFSDVDLAEWSATVNVGIQAAYILTKAVWQLMTDAGGGSVIYVSSQSGIKGFEDETPYCTAKHGLEGMMKCLAMEGKPRNIAVNTITPGMYMHTPMSEANYPDDLKSKWIDPILLAPAFVKLAQQDTSGITGERTNAWEISEAIRAEAD